MSLLVQVVGATLMIGAALVAGEGFPGGAPLVLSILAGVCGVVGIVSLYQGLAVGRMGVVAPVTGVLATSAPVVVGIVLDGAPPTIVAVGIGLALVAVVLVSRAPAVGDRRSGIEYALLAGVGIGGFDVFFGLVPEGFVFWPLVVLKVTAAAVIVTVAVVGRRAWRIPRPVTPAVVGVAIADMAGNGFYLLAAQAGALAIASVLSALYPVVTVLLAAVLLRERISGGHAVGIAAAIVAIVLIGSGSAIPTG